MANSQQINTSELRYRRLFEAAQDGILILNAETGAITDVNPFLIKMLGYSREDLVEKKLWEVGAFQDVKVNQNAFVALTEEEYVRYDDLPLRAENGRLIDVEIVSNVYWVGEERVIQCNIRDITERKRVQDALLKSQALLREQSVRDDLTGLFNRRYTLETLERELLRASRKQQPLGIIMLDVDDLKKFKDAWGHEVANDALRSLAILLFNQVRAEDIACRYGSDEFILILPDASRGVTLERAQRICELARQLRIEFEGLSLAVATLSVGVAVFPEHGQTTAALLMAADTALYRAKQAGRNCVVVAG